MGRLYALAGAASGMLGQERHLSLFYACILPAQSPPASAQRRAWKKQSSEYQGYDVVRLPGESEATVSGVHEHLDTHGYSPLARSAQASEPRRALLVLSCPHSVGPPQIVPSIRALLRYLLADQDAGSSAEVAQPPGHTAAAPARPAPASAPPLCARGSIHSGGASSVPPTPTPRPGCLEPAIHTGGQLSPRRPVETISTPPTPV